MKMTPQQTSLQKALSSKDLGSWIQEGGKKMRASVQRRRSSSAITRALSKSKSNSREITLFPANSGNGLLLGAFCSPSNMLILKERVQLTSGWQTQERHLFLFNDSLVIAKSKSSSSLKLKKQVHLNELWITSCLSEISEKKLSSDNSFVLGWPTTNYIVTFSSSDTKEKWLSTLCWHINEIKKNEYPKKLPISVLYLDAEELTSSATINVTNMDDADKVIRMASEQLGIPGKPGDYHLWVVSGKDEPSYPLYGHEHPFSIALHCFRESHEMPKGSNNNLFLDQGSETVIVEQLPRERHCQFVLRLRPQVHENAGRESVQKHSRRKKSLIDWALRRTGSTTLSSHVPQSPNTPRKLFGLSLSSICLNGNLPKPIMDMLMLLYEEGPNTKGIFRRSANAKTCKELKEKLISGNDVQIDRESVFVAAAVITDFLRNIPDSILSSDMHGLWMEVTEMENHEYKIETIKRLVEQLPDANAVLLQHLFAVLYHINENSEENQMTAFNLALCIAPNILWLPTPSDPEEETKSTKKVAILVQFIIENYQLIFGQDVASLFRKPDKDPATSTEDLSGIIHGQDSSDELEFTASDLDKSDPNLLKDTDGMFDESLLMDEREDWDLFSEIAACYQSKTRMDSLECFNKDPFSCLNAACCLNPSRDRCSSEPSVCLSSKICTQDHEPVARQSSCDATIMHNHIEYINQLKQLQLETKKLLNTELNSAMNKRTIRRSPQPSCRQKKTTQNLAPSSRSSYSSLSSTTTSPSVSSLSSLDSAFSYCSESSVFSPTDVTSLPFMFGTSARLHTLSPEISKKKLKEWHLPLSTLFADTPCGLDLGERQEISSDKTNEIVNDELTSEAIIQRNTLDNISRKELDCDVHCSVQSETGSITLETKPETKYIEVKAENGHCVRKETSIKHVEIRRQESSNDDSLKSTRVMLFMPPNIIPANNQNGQNENIGVEGSDTQSVKLQIPQTVFYGQNAPLVLHSVSRRQHSDLEKPHWQTQLKHVKSPSPTKTTLTDNKQAEDCPLVCVDKDLNGVQVLEKVDTEETIKDSEVKRSHGKSIASFTQTIRIILPTSVRNTVREYFKHSDEQSSSSSQEETLEQKVMDSRTEDFHLSGADTSGETKKKTCVVVEESFV
ncbi:rho GTPase-activating protein 20-like [Pelobates fuscus]|uniref:rho GTPase-activating protein 20-like n=1 Tax=Pelobates fuscus TaxID=191477 RepID=UPI002FE4D723